jgi:intracellular multiplication protein IcmB
MQWLKKLIFPFQAGLRHAVESFIHIETMDDEHTMAAREGSLVSYLKIEGSRHIIGEHEYNHLIQAATLRIGAKFDRMGHAMQVYFVRDPDRIDTELSAHIHPSRKTADALGMNLDDLFDERERHLKRFLCSEECYFVLWSRPSLLSKAEFKRTIEESRARKWLNGGYAQNPLAGLNSLRTRHKSYVSSVQTALRELGIKNEMLNAHDAMRAVRRNLYPTRANENWSPCLPGDPIPPRQPESVTDLSDILWPTLRSQLVAGDSKILSESTVRIGETLWAGADLTLAPMDPSPFPMLLNRLFEAGVPYRISFLIEGGGANTIQFRNFAASVLGVTNALNKQIKFSLEGLERLARREPVVRLRVSFATWAPRGQMNLLQDRLSTLLQAVEGWGYCQVSEFSGDALDCVMSSAMGIHCGSTAPAAVAPMYEVMKLMPWQRASSPFETGSVILRTPDGKIWPYQTGTNLTTTWFDLIFAQPGAGKSVLMNSLNLGTCLGAGLSKLPYVAVIDIGPSSSGLISLIKESLPMEQQHEVAYYRLQMTHKFAVNPFDTQLGCRAPLPDERSYLTELLTLLATPAGAEKPYDGIQQLVGLVVDEMYRWRDDTHSNAEPRPYLPRLNYDVDELLSIKKVRLPDDPYWWDVVDALFELGEYHMASVAQRQAVPTLSDAITASRRPQIRSLLEETTIGGSSEGILNAFERMITSAIRELPILSSVTQFDITDTRICALDLMDVAPQGDEAADRQTAIMYMLARHVLVRSWWMGKDSLQFVHPKYQDYHEARLQDISESPKRLCYDEFHRTSASASVRGQIIRDVREGRKRGVQIVLASQLLDDFDKNMVDLATGVWVLGTAISDQAVSDVQKRFGLSETAKSVIRYRLTGPKSGGAPALFVLGTTEGRYEQHLINTLGPIELWALSTSTEDVLIRTALYERIGANKARLILAARFPGGSARGEIKRRVLMRAAKESESKSALQSVVIQDIIEEMAQAAFDRDLKITQQA